MKSFLLTSLGIYLLLCLALFMLQRKVLYYPQPSHVSGTLPAHIKAIEYHANGEILKGWLLNPDHDKAVIYYGGNAESIEYNIPLFQQLNLGYSVYFIPYRGYGESSGSPSEQTLYDDALFIYDQIALAHSGISLIGRSLGSGIATHVAARRDVEQLVLITPFDSIENVAKSVYWMFPVSWLLTEKYRSWGNVSDIEAKTSIIIAANDQIIPRERSDKLIEHFQQKQLESVIIDEANHNDISLYPAFASSLKAALEAN